MVIHVEQDAAIGGLDDLVQELPLSHLGLVTTPHSCSHSRPQSGSRGSPALSPNSSCGGIHGFKGVRQRKQIMRVSVRPHSPSTGDLRATAYGCAG